MPEPEPQTKTRPARDPQALSSEYHKARKQLMLWSGILFIWALVGIDLEKAKEAGGNAGAIITAIKSPQAIPWVLVVLVAYFVFKVGVEWSQCETRRRGTLASRIDVGSAWLVAFLACALYSYQAISRIQIADVIQTSDKVKSSMLGVAVGVTLGMALLFRLHKWNVKPPKTTYIGYTVVMPLLSVIVFFFLLPQMVISMKHAIAAAGVSIAVIILSYLFLLRRTRPRAERPESI